jgi:hypothetical protein
MAMWFSHKMKPCIYTSTGGINAAMTTVFLMMKLVNSFLFILIMYRYKFSFLYQWKFSFKKTTLQGGTYILKKTWKINKMKQLVNTTFYNQ